MSGAADMTGALIGRLTAELRPVRRLARPGWRAASWLGLVALAAVWLAIRADLGAVAARVMAHSDMWLSVAGSTLTAVFACVAVLMLALPDRDGRWALLPLPPLALWLGASGIGCLRQDAIALVHPASLMEASSACLPFILTSSALLALPLGVLIWRARPLRIGLVALLGGLALAAASASLLWLSHPFDASLADLIVHMAAVALVIVCCRIAALFLPE